MARLGDAFAPRLRCPRLRPAGRASHALPALAFPALALPALALPALALPAQASAPMDRSRRATRMPIVKPATTSIRAPTRMKKNGDVAEALTTRNSTRLAINT